MQQKTTQSQEKYWSRKFLKCFSLLGIHFELLTATGKTSLIESMSHFMQLKCSLALQCSRGHIRTHIVHCLLPLFARLTPQHYVWECCSWGYNLIHIEETHENSLIKQQSILWSWRPVLQKKHIVWQSNVTAFALILSCLLNTNVYTTPYSTVSWLDSFWHTLIF